MVTREIPHSDHGNDVGNDMEGDGAHAGPSSTPVATPQQEHTFSPTRTSLVDRVQQWREARASTDAFIADLLEENQRACRELDALKAQNRSLRREKADVEERYATEREDWGRFKAWWSQALDRKHERLSTSSPVSRVKDEVGHVQGASDPSTPTPAAADSSSPTTCSVRLSKEDEKLFERVGMPVTTIKNIKRASMRGAGGLPSPLTPSVSREDRRGAQLQPQGAYRALSVQRASGLSREEIRSDYAEDEAKSCERRSDSNDAKASRKSINAEYEIDPARNNGKAFLHKEVVRNKTERKHMHAYDCSCCRDYYQRIGPIAKRPFEDIRNESEKREEDAEDHTDEIQRHKQLASRHRDFGPPPSTPQGYWDINFPSTQQIQMINDSAGEARQQQRRRIANDPRFRRRVS